MQLDIKNHPSEQYVTSKKNKKNVTVIITP